MCGGLEFRTRKGNAAAHGLFPDEPEIIRVTFPNPKAALLLDEGTNLWLPWGRRREESGDWPEGGWARAESLAKGFWTRWDPEPVLVFPVRWMEKDHNGKSYWFQLEAGQGIACLKLRKAPATPIYVITEPSPPDFMEIHDRIPRICENRPIP